MFSDAKSRETSRFEVVYTDISLDFSSLETSKIHEETKPLFFFLAQ